MAPALLVCVIAVVVILVSITRSGTMLYALRRVWTASSPQDRRRFLIQLPAMFVFLAGSAVIPIVKPFGRDSIGYEMFALAIIVLLIGVFVPLILAFQNRHEPSQRQKSTIKKQHHP